MLKVVLACHCDTYTVLFSFLGVSKCALYTTSLNCIHNQRLSGFSFGFKPQTNILCDLHNHDFG